ncbi:alcohol dehydrogenase [Pleurostoma richardsiae]|uniref:Alcohol dehydrogenase n=1 Tax=Pleurostoma richardsiae TaxID=41990 RepID=A0AA38VKB2_9PEZI|nr:alcohol dehydrogenase [Pleurostoma richardsiae]
MANHAIVIRGAGDAHIVEVSVPKLRDDYIIVKVKAVALNPTDFMHVDYFPSPGARVGCDYAGVVEEVGPKVTKPFKKGDRVAGVVHGSNAVQHEDGAFAEFITAKGDLQIQIPDKLGYEEAATLGVGITTVGQGLYQSLELPEPETPAAEKLPVLIYGGSTATGALAVQFAHQSGLEVIATASPRNFDYVKSLGADVVFDYNSETCAEDIKGHTQGRLKHVFDCISKNKSTEISVRAMSDDGGVYSSLLPVPEDKVKSLNDKVANKFTLAYSATGESFEFGPQTFEANPADFEFSKRFWAVSEKLLRDGKIKPHRLSVNEGGSGLTGVLKGLQAVREGKVSGKKLVYTL